MTLHHPYIQYADDFCAKNHLRRLTCSVGLCVHHTCYLLARTQSKKNDDVANATAILASMVFIPSLQWLSPHVICYSVGNTR